MKVKFDMKEVGWQVLLGVFLVSLSVVLYFVHYIVFHDSHHIFIYFVGDIAFVPIEVLLVTLIIHKLLDKKEKKTRLKKLNMVIGAFFSEVGTMLITEITRFDNNIKDLQDKLCINDNWEDKKFKAIRSGLTNYTHSITVNNDDLVPLHATLVKKRQFMLGLLENPNLLEHETFTDLLWAIFHLIEELMVREKMEETVKEDLDHITGDILRAYRLLLTEWLVYMKHLKTDYPYLFSLAVRTNPFQSMKKN